MSGDDNQIIAARSALLDALTALEEHKDSVILVGAQAIYLHTGKAEIALAEFTKDSDIALDTRTLGSEPLIEQAMQAAGFMITGQPGAWVNKDGVPVDLMVPEGIAGGAGRRSVRMPPHDKTAARRTVGLEAALIDNQVMKIPSLDLSDGRTAEMRVAGLAALLVAKLHKLGERAVIAGTNRLNDKDAHDIYRILVATTTLELATTWIDLTRDPVSADTTTQATAYLDELFASAPDAVGAVMAGRAETTIGDPALVQAASHALAEDLLTALRA